MKQLSVFQLLIVAFAMICPNISCTGKAESKERIDNTISQIETVITLKDSLKNNWALSKSETIETTLKQDTIVIVSTDAFLYYPFGKIKDIKLLSQKLSNLQPEINYFDSWQKLIYSHTGDKLEFLKFINYDKDYPNNEFIQIYNVDIITNCFALDHNIQVGMSKQELFNIMNISNNQSSDDIEVIELISGLSGVWHYYIFTGEVLSRIIIKTDYGNG